MQNFRKPTYTGEELLAAQAQAFSKGKDNARMFDKVMEQHGEDYLLAEYRAHQQNAPDTPYVFDNPYAFRLQQLRKIHPDPESTS